MSKENKQFYDFGPFRIDLEERELLRENEPIPLTPKAFETLLILVRNSGRVVTKEDLMKALWPDSFVEESNLSQNIFILRKALGDSAQDPRYIATVSGRGYRFSQHVKQVAAENPLMAGSPEPSPVEADDPAPLLGSSSGSASHWRPHFALGVILGIGILLATGYLTWHASRLQPRAAVGRMMLAVLPFQNLTGDADQEYFADGFTEELITKLGRLHPAQLGVIARISVMGYKNTSKRLDQIGHELGVQYVLEGSVRRSGDRVRITAQLISVADQSHLWADDYDRRLQDVFTVQDDVAIAVANQTQLKIDSAKEAGVAHLRTVNPEAYEAYLRGRFFWNQRTEAGFRKSVGYFETAIAKDPGFAEAYAGLADSCLLLGGYGFEPQKSAMPKAKAAALHALALDERLADAYTSLAMINEQYEWNWKEAEENYKHAIELNPNYSVAHHWYGDGYLAGMGRLDEAIAELRQAQELDPLSLVIGTDLAKRLCDAGYYDEGVKRFRKILELDPDFVVAHYFLSQTYTQQGLYPAAIAEVEKIRSPDPSRSAMSQLARIYALQGRRGEALKIAEELQQSSKQTYIDAFYVANIYLALGDKDAALTWLERAYEQHSPAMNGLKSSVEYAPIRSDLRFIDLMRRVGFSP